MRWQRYWEEWWLAEPECRLPMTGLATTNLTQLEQSWWARPWEDWPSWTSLLPDQVKAIFTSASKHQSQLRRLNVEGNDLSWVPIRDLVAALSSMEEIVRALTSFTSSRIRAVLNVDFPKHGWRRMRVFFSMAGLNLSGRLWGKVQWCRGQEQAIHQDQRQWTKVESSSIQIGQPYKYVHVQNPCANNYVNMWTFNLGQSWYLGIHVSHCIQSYGNLAKFNVICDPLIAAFVGKMRSIFLLN